MTLFLLLLITIDDSYLQLKDATASIDLILSNFTDFNVTKLIGKIVKVIKFDKIILEWSVISGKEWEILYFVTNFDNIETMEPKSMHPEVRDENSTENKNKYSWKVLYASRPTFNISKEFPSVYVAVRKLTKSCCPREDPQSVFDNESRNNPTKFIELSLQDFPCAVFVTPGTIVTSTVSQTLEEKYVSLLQIHLKKLQKLNPALNSERYVNFFQKKVYLFL